MSAQDAVLSVWEKLLYVAGGSVLGAVAALVVVWWVIKNWWTRR